MNIEEALKLATIDRLDAEVLLAHLLKKDRTWLMAHREELVPGDEWNLLLEQRLQGKPIAYIIGSKEFYGRPFYVNEHVLIPRPATEGLIDFAKGLLQNGSSNERDLDTDIIGIATMFDDVSDVSLIVDIGTGSGCIAVTLALETRYNILATDISERAIEVAKINAQNHNVSHRIEFRTGNLLEPIADVTEPFILVSNPPYIPSSEELMPDVADFEPHTALFGGEDGSDLVGEIVSQAKTHPSCRGVVMECRSHHRSIFV